MLTTNNCVNLEDYAFKSSPESCSDNSYTTDYTDLPSDEDFLQQLSSDLDIPLLLNPGEDEMSLLNSFFDKSPEEILSEITVPSTKLDDITELEQLDFTQWGPEYFPNLKSEMKTEPFDASCCSSSSDSYKSNSPTQLIRDVKDEIKTPPSSPNSLINSPKFKNTMVTVVPQNTIKITKLPPKRVPIQPKTPYKIPSAKDKVMLIKSTPMLANTTNNDNISSSNVVLVDNISRVPIANITTIPPVAPTTINVNRIATSCNIPSVILKSSNNNLSLNNVDPRILKRQQRKIKNRESACLSRKKKKDYLTSLENQVKELSVENQKLKLLNLQLKDRLFKYEGQSVQNNSNKNVKNSVILCMFFFVIAFRLDYVRNPFYTRNDVDIIKSEVSDVEDHHGRSLLWTSERIDSTTQKNSSNFLQFSMCPATINQTESDRLVLELERWIGKPKNENLNNNNNNSTVNLKIANTPLRAVRKKKQKKILSPLIPSMYGIGKSSNNEIQVFAPTPEQIYSEFFEAINRQGDTYYVVSFTDHHMLLPALYHNKTRRPKMSLIMPSMLPDATTSLPTMIPLMQIDCEVLDTRLLKIRYGLIPQHLRTQGNSTTNQNKHSQSGGVSKTNESSRNFTNEKPYKPYFIKQNSLASEFYNLH